MKYNITLDALGLTKIVFLLSLILGIVPLNNPASAADIDLPDFGTNRPPAQTFYIPIPEDNLLTALKVISSAPVEPTQTYISLAVFVDGTFIYYDQWENGYDRDIANPNNLYALTNLGGTQIWGDGDPSNGFPLGYPSDVLKAGDVIILANAVNSTTRKTVIDWDGGDKIGATKPIAVTRAVWASGSNTLLAGANEVYDTAFFGTEFQSPVGINSPDSYQMFEYTALTIMASEDNTEVKVDADRNGTFEQVVTINEGETVFVNGGVKVGGRVVANKPVQVDLLTGDIGSNYESRFFRLLPTSTWTSALTAPVATTTSFNDTSSGTTVWLYNPTASSITIKQTSRSSASANTLSTSNITVPANGNASVVLTEGCAARFESTTGANFYALSAIDSTAKNSNGTGNQTWDWGYALVPDDALTAQVLVGLGIGRDPTSSTNPNENGSPVWVTPIGNGNTKVRVYVDYDSDPNTGSAAGVDANGNKYDAYYDLRELVSQKVFNPSGNQTGVLIYTIKDGVKLAAAWGADPKNTSAGAPGLDFGTGIPPLPAFFMQKTSSLLADSDGDGYITPNDVIRYDIMIENVGRQPVTDLRVHDVLPSSISYLLGSTRFTDKDGVVSSIADLETNPRFPIGKTGGYLLPGFLPIASSWHITYDTQVGPFNANSGVESIQNKASVSSGSTVYTNGVIDALRGRVGDYVWLDTNTNGIQEVGESGVNGVGVRLLKADGTQAFNDFDLPYEFVTRQGDDGRDGFYLFTGVRPGQYIVEFLTPLGYVFTQHSAGSSADKDSDAGTGAALNATEIFQLDGGQFKLDVDAGLIKLGSISGSTFIDQNGDGIVDPEDTAPIFGVTVELLDAEGTVVATTTTQADGSYSFTSLLPGTYTVRQTDLPNWVSTKDTQGAAKDNLISVTLPFGEDSVGNNFYDTMPVSIGDRVWIDANRNGIQDAGELGLSGVTVQLLTNGIVAATTTTAPNGNYLFENKNPGTYSVNFIAPVGYVFTTPVVGANNAIDSNAAVDGSVAAFALPYGTVDLKIDAGLFRLNASVEIVKTAGSAADGATWTINGPADVVYTYTVKNTGETYLSNLVVVDDKLGAIGTVSGPLAPNATFVLTKTAPNISAPVVNIGTVTANPTDSNGNDLPGFADVTDDDDAKVFVIPYASLGDFVWVDLNANGIQDAGEPGLPGVSVTLYKDGSTVATTTTGSNGSYLFQDLLEGSYSVGFSTPEGYSVTTANVGDDAKDSDIAATGLTSTFPLTGGSNRTDIDAGYVRLPASVEIIKTAGTAPDGTVLTFQGTSDVLYTYTVKNTGSTYLINLVVTDDKLLAVGTIPGTLAPGAEATLTKTATAVSADVVNIGTVTGTPSNASGTPLVGFENVTDTDDASVVVVPLSFIGDFVWNDLNKDGVQDAGEPGLAGVTVTLYTNGVVVASTTTDANGGYGFNDLYADDYSLTFTAPSSYTATAANVGDDAKDSDINASGVIASFPLAAGLIDRTRDAGFVRLAASVEIVKRAGGAADGETLTIYGASDVLYTYVVKNTGETYLSNLVVTDDKLGAVGTVAGPLAPNATVTLTLTATDVSTDVVNIATVTANPTDAAGADLDGLADVTDTDDAVVEVIPYSSIGNFVWVDSNGNGIQDAVELGLAGVSVVLNTNGVVVASTTTDATGAYLFDNLLAGDYQVGFTAPSGYVATAANVCCDARDSDLNSATGKTEVFALGAGINDDTRDAGFVLLTAGVEIVKTAGDAPDGQVLRFVGSADVLYTYVVKNIGQTYLANLVVTDDKLGTIGTVTGPLAPNATATLDATASAVSNSVTNIGTVVATPTDSEGVPLVALTDVTDNDDAVVEVTPETPTPDPTICELLDFGKTFNAIIFGNLDINGGDTEGNLLVWGNASLPAGYSVGQSVVGEPMPIAGIYDDALIVGGNLFIGPQGINGNVVYGGAYSGFDRKYQPYAVRHVTPVTLDDNGNVPEDHSGMTSADMLAMVDEISARLNAWDERGVVSKETDESGSLILVGNDPDLNIFSITAEQWSGDRIKRTIDAPQGSSVIINIRGTDVAITNGDMELLGVSRNEVLIHYVDATSITTSSFDHNGSVLAPLADATLTSGSIQGVAIFGGNVTTSDGFEFHNFPMNVFHCPISPSVRIVTTVNDAHDGYVLDISSASDILVRQTVINTGSSWLREVALTAADGSVVTLGDLAPRGVVVVETIVANAGADAVYTASVVATPSSADGSRVGGFTSVADSDIAAVAFIDETNPENPEDPGSGSSGMADFHVSDVWFNVEPTTTGEVFSVSIKVENTGDATSTRGKIKLYLADTNHPLNSASPSEVPTALFDLGTFIPAEVKVFTFKGLVSQPVTGHYRVIILVDPDNEVLEYSDGDNHGTLYYWLAAVTVQITIGADGITLTWNNEWGQVYTIMASSDLEEWEPYPGYEGILSSRDDDGSMHNTVTLPFSEDAQFYKLRVDQQ